MKGLKKDMVGHSTRAPRLGLILKGWVERTFLISQPPDLNSGLRKLTHGARSFQFLVLSGFLFLLLQFLKFL